MAVGREAADLYAPQPRPLVVSHHGGSSCLMKQSTSQAIHDPTTLQEARYTHNSTLPMELQGSRRNASAERRNVVLGVVQGDHCCAINR